MGTENWGVPQKIMRIGKKRQRGLPHSTLPLALLLELFDFAADEVALQHAEMLQE